jgi:hypothetical protein
VAHVINAWDFNATRIGDATNMEADGTRVCDAGICSLAAGVRLPAGALVTRIELDACDTSATQYVGVNLFRVVAGVTRVFLAAANTGGANTPGCTRIGTPLPIPETIDNLTNSYILLINMGAAASQVGLLAVRVFYILQVSPAPAVASFSDVPTSHPFFQFVEALVASGITAGCGGGNYCSDEAVTRGQMAVFLSKALGLHFAP